MNTRFTFARTYLTPLATYLVAMVFCVPLLAADCATDRVELRGAWGQARFTVEIADTNQSRARGLMFRESLASNHSMLFIYDRPGRPSFWMKNTLIPLDMLFVTPTGVVQHVHSMARPHDLSSIVGGSGISMVLEIRGGMAAILGISPGTQLRHQSIPAEIAIWPCGSFD